MMHSQLEGLFDDIPKGFQVGEVIKTDEKMPPDTAAYEREPKGSGKSAHILVMKLADRYYAAFAVAKKSKNN